MERHGTDCACCHDEFGLSGSVAPGSGITRIRLSDGAGLRLDVAVNPYENFFRHVELQQPVLASVVLADGTEIGMKAPAPGNCNACHQEGSPLGLLGSRGITEP